MSLAFDFFLQFFAVRATMQECRAQTQLTNQPRPGKLAAQSVASVEHVCHFLHQAYPLCLPAGHLRYGRYMHWLRLPNRDPHVLHQQVHGELPDLGTHQLGERAKGLAAV